MGDGWWVNHPNTQIDDDSLPLQVARECAKRSDFRGFPRVREPVERSRPPCRTGLRVMWR
jgi:hypothetical protein